MRDRESEEGFISCARSKAYVFKPLWLQCITGNLYSWVYADLKVSSFTWLVSRICYTVMDVLTVQYCALMTVSVTASFFFFFALLVSHMMYCNIFEKISVLKF